MSFRAQQWRCGSLTHPEATLRPAPKWRNWQTRWTQNPVGLAPRVGSIPTFGIRSAPAPALYLRLGGSYTPAMVSCPTCGRANPDGFKFCGECGAPLTGQAAPGRELRKLVTAVFCDITGSTSLGEQLDPESLRRVIG